jgi:hypothetical protein
LAAFGELADLGGDNGKAFAMRPGACRFDGGIQCEQGLK